MEALLARSFCALPRLSSSRDIRDCNVRIQYPIQRAYHREISCSTERHSRCFLNQRLKNPDVSLERFHMPRRVNATSGHISESVPESYDRKITLESLLAALNVLWRFSRPHTIIGTTMSIISVSLLALESRSDFSLSFIFGLLEAIVASLFMNIYVVGLNQLFDIEIDKINKPDLPLAAGEYSLRTGITVVLISAVMSFGIGFLVGSWPLFWALFITFVLGTAYSVDFPFLRWKRFAVVAAICIFAVRAVVVQLAFFLHMQTFVFRRPALLTRPLIFATAFMSFFSVVIALFKDIPDIDGDRIYGIQSYSVRLGQRKVFWICISLLEVAYGVAMVVGATSSSVWSIYPTILGHLFLAIVLGLRAQSLDLKNKSAIKAFYMFIWKLFYAEYLIVPLVR